jgi:hypothetical protein
MQVLCRVGLPHCLERNDKKNVCTCSVQTQLWNICNLRWGESFNVESKDTESDGITFTDIKGGNKSLFDLFL